MLCCSVLLWFEAEAFLQVGGDGVGVELAGGDVFDEFVPFVFAYGVLEGALQSLDEQGLDFAADLALGAL